MPGPGFGPGYGHRQRSVATLSTVTQPALASLEPGPAWDGSAGSGYASVPVDPVRTTAKPACRLLVVPNQFFTESLLVGVYAGAAYANSLADNLGLEKVVFHFEGGSVAVMRPSVQSFADANGEEVAYLGWWTQLQHPGAHGEALLYVEAVPKEAAMQRRVIGPFSFFPNGVEHDAEYTIEPSRAEIAGQRYQGFNANLLKNIRDTGARNPRVVFKEGGTYAMGMWSPYTPAGHLTVEAAAPVTFANPPGSYGTFRCKIDGLWFRGSNITIDMADAGDIYHEGTARQHVFDGCRITNSRGRWATWQDGRMRPVSYIVRGEPRFLETRIDNLPNPCRNSPLARGVRIADTYADVFSNALCVIGTRTRGVDQSRFYDGIPALDVRFDGSGGTASIEASGNSLSKTFTLKRHGVDISSFSTAASTANWNGGVGGAYFVQDVADWINAQPGWSATVRDSTLCGTYLGEPGGKGRSFYPIDCLNRTVTLETAVDIHSDWHQMTGPLENVVIADNVGWDMRTQSVLWGFEMKDALLVNTVMHNASYDAASQSQFSSRFSHVVIAHCNWPTQKVNFRNGFSADVDSAFIRNAAHSISLEDGSGGLVIKSNHIDAGQPAPPGSIDTQAGGDVVSNYVDAGTGDFRPAGSLLANRAAPRLMRDLGGAVRTAQAPPGALAS